MTYYTNQQAYDKAKATIVAQGGFSFDESGDCCQYRGDNGRKCAVGALITDEEYRPSMDGSTVAGMLR